MQPAGAHASSRTAPNPWAAARHLDRLFTKALAKEVGRYRINVNCVCPAGVIPEKKEHVSELSMTQGVTQDTMPEDMKKMQLKLYPIGRVAVPQDVANTCVFIASDAASFIHGQTISVNGGYSTL